MGGSKAGYILIDDPQQRTVRFAEEHKQASQEWNTWATELEQALNQTITEMNKYKSSKHQNNEFQAHIKVQQQYAKLIEMMDGISTKFTKMDKFANHIQRQSTNNKHKIEQYEGRIDEYKQTTANLQLQIQGQIAIHHQQTLQHKQKITELNDEINKLKQRIKDKNDTKKTNEIQIESDKEMRSKMEI